MSQVVRARCAREGYGAGRVGIRGGYTGWVQEGNTQPTDQPAAARSHRRPATAGSGPLLQGGVGRMQVAGITGSGDGGGDGYIPTLRARSGPAGPSLGYTLRMPPPGHKGEIPPHIL